MYADVFWDLKIYVFEALARAYKLHFFLSVQLGGLPPPPIPTGYATAHPTAPVAQKLKIKRKSQKSNASQKNQT